MMMMWWKRVTSEEHSNIHYLKKKDVFCMNVFLCFSQNYTHFNIPYYCLVWPVTLNTSPCHAVYVRTDLKVDTKETETVKVRRFLQCCTESLQKINSDKIKKKKAACQSERTGQRSRSNRKNNQNKKKKKKKPWQWVESGARSYLHN